MSEYIYLAYRTATYALVHANFVEKEPLVVARVPAQIVDEALGRVHQRFQSRLQVGAHRLESERRRLRRLGHERTTTVAAAVIALICFQERFCDVGQRRLIELKKMDYKLL